MLIYKTGDIRPFGAKRYAKHALHSLVLLLPSGYDEEQAFAFAAIAALTYTMQAQGGVQVVEMACAAYMRKYRESIKHEFAF